MPPIQKACAVIAVVLWPTCAPAELPDLDSARAGNYCEDQWTKRGTLDRDMYRYCMERQTDGYHDAKALRDKYKGINDMDFIADYAVRKWLRAREYQYDMVAYEIERQIDAFLNISQDMKAGRYAEDAVLACLMQWYRETEPQWDMVEYCLEN